MNQAIRIRKIEKCDTENILRWRNCESVTRNFIYRKELTKEEHEKWLDTNIASGRAVQFIIEEVITGLPIGSVYLRDIDHTHKKAEFGIFIGEDSARGKGYGSLATRLILKYAFDEMGLNRVFLRVFSNNKSAIKCYLNAGFREEGLFREDVLIDGTFYDMMFMSILKNEWREG